MEKLNEVKQALKYLENDAKAYADKFSASMIVSTKNILAIAEAFRALEQRAEAAEAKLAAREQQERGESLWEKMGMTEEDKYKIPTLPEEVTAQDMRETLNVLLHEEEAQAAATGFNQCLMECVPIYDAALRSQKVIERLLTELDEMQESWNYNHTNSVTQRKRAEAAEKERDRRIANYKHLIDQHMPRTIDGCDEGWSRVIEAHELQTKLEAAEAKLAALEKQERKDA